MFYLQPHQVNGGPCHILDIGGGVYVNDCDYDGAYESLNHIYGDLQVKSSHQQRRVFSAIIESSVYFIS